MNHRIPKILATLLTAILLLPTVPAAAAAQPTSYKAKAAATPSFTVKSMSIKDVVVKKNTCYTRQVKLKSKSSAKTWTFHTRVTKHGEPLRIAMSWPFSYPYADFDSKHNPKKSQKVAICVYPALLGRVDIGPGHAFVKAGKKTVEVRSKKQAHFYVRANTKAKLKAKRSGKYVKLTLTASKYKLTQKNWKFSGHYVSYSPKAAHLQKKQAGKWKTVKTVALKKGKKTVKLKAPKKASYRLLLDQKSKTAKSTSKAVKK